MPVAKPEYIERIQLVIHQLHGAVAKHVATVPVHEVFQGRTVWQGEVEVFELPGHPKAKRCYAWSHREGKDYEGERFVTVLELPPVFSAATAVRAAIAKDAERK